MRFPSKFFFIWTWSHQSSHHNERGPSISRQKRVSTARSWWGGDVTCMIPECGNAGSRNEVHALFSTMVIYGWSRSAREMLGIKWWRSRRSITEKRKRSENRKFVRLSHWERRHLAGWSIWSGSRVVDFRVASCLFRFRWIEVKDCILRQEASR